MRKMNMLGRTGKWGILHVRKVVENRGKSTWGKWYKLV